MRKTHWFSKALGIFLAMMAVWIASALVLNEVFAQSSPFSLVLRSKLAADYSQERNDANFGPLRLSIIRETLKDLGFGSDEAEDIALSNLSELDDPVPTATALNFAGDSPFTTTATKLPESTSTPEPTSTALLTKIPTRIQMKKTKVVTLPPVGTTVATLAPWSDTVKPVLSGGSLNPTPGALASCSIGIGLSGLRVKDAPVSSGIEWVKVKYKIEGPNSLGYVYSANLSPPDSGGWSGSAWDAIYSGMVYVDFEGGYVFSWGGRKGLALSAMETATPTPELATATHTLLSPTPTDPPVPPTACDTPIPPTTTHTPNSNPFTVTLWAGAQDNNGNVNYLFLGAYTMPANCE
jgi:hypothetical protein